MFPDIEVLKEHVVLGTEAEAPPHAAHVLCDVVTIDGGRARGRGEHSREDRHRGGLPCNRVRSAFRSSDQKPLTSSIVSEKGGDLSLISRECHSVNCVNCLSSKLLRSKKVRHDNLFWT